MIRKTTYNLEICETAAELNKAAAECMISIARNSIAERGRFVISLSGGQTPRHLFALLADPLYRKRIDWKKTFVFWGDERCVPMDDEQNNAFEVKQILLNHVPVPVSQVYPVPVDLSPVDAAQKYEQTIREFFGAAPARFDLMLLGLGTNGHTASLFPGTTILEEKIAGVRAVYVVEENRFRVSMTAPMINEAKHILFLVTGVGKAQVVKEVLSPADPGLRHPAQLIRPSDGELYWFLDHAAASLLPA